MGSAREHDDSQIHPAFSGKTEQDSTRLWAKSASPTVVTPLPVSEMTWAENSSVKSRLRISRLGAWEGGSMLAVSWRSGFHRGKSRSSCLAGFRLDNKKAGMLVIKPPPIASAQSSQCRGCKCRKLATAGACTMIPHKISDRGAMIHAQTPRIRLSNTVSMALAPVRAASAMARACSTFLPGRRLRW